MVREISELASMIVGMDNVGIGVSNLQLSVEFYQRLGFLKSFENDRGCTMAAASAKLFLFVANPNHRPVPRALLTLGSNPPGVDHISLLVDNVDETHAELS